MSEEKRANLMPLCAAFNLLQLKADGSVAINTAQVSHWTADAHGGSVVTMQNGEEFDLNPAETDELVNATRRALEQAHKQARGSNIVTPDMALGRGM